MKLIVVLFLVGFMYNCKVQTKIIGNWKYSSSLDIENNKLVLESIGELTKDFSILKDTTGFCDKKQAVFYKKFNKNKFFGLMAVNNSLNEDADWRISYLISNLNEDQPMVTHYEGDDYNLGKVMEYHIDKLTDDSLILFTDRIYNLSGKRQKLKHVFIRY